MAYIEKATGQFGQYLQYIFLGNGLVYYSGVMSIVLGTYWFFRAEKGIRRGIAVGYPASNARLIPWLRWGGLGLAVFGLLAITLQLFGFFDWLNTL
jgi:hypothetical protein